MTPVFTLPPPPASTIPRRALPAVRARRAQRAAGASGQPRGAADASRRPIRVNPRSRTRGGHGRAAPGLYARVNRRLSGHTRSLSSRGCNVTRPAALLTSGILVVSILQHADNDCAKNLSSSLGFKLSEFKKNNGLGHLLFAPFCGVWSANRFHWFC